MPAIVRLQNALLYLLTVPVNVTDVKNETHSLTRKRFARVTGRPTQVIHAPRLHPL